MTLQTYLDRLTKGKGRLPEGSIICLPKKYQGLFYTPKPTFNLYPIIFTH